MEAQGGIGSVGSYDAKLSGGMIEVSVGVKIDLAGELQKLVESGKVSNEFEKAALAVVIGLVKGIA